MSAPHLHTCQHHQHVQIASSLLVPMEAVISVCLTSPALGRIQVVTRTGGLGQPLASHGDEQRVAREAGSLVALHVIAFCLGRVPNTLVQFAYIII